VSRSVLLVEDDPRVRRALYLALRDEGYAVSLAGTGREGLAALDSATPDVVLLDLMLADVDGFAVCRQIRHDSDVPVIMVTARADSHDVVAGLEAGADDYVTKPLVAKELSARIRALLRRVEPSRTPRRIRAGDLEIRVDEGVVLRAGGRLHLTRTEFKLLAELALAPGVCSREELLERVWGYGYFDDSRLVDVHVRRLRTKVEQDPANPSIVVTARGLGYRLVR
jgi:DNA-binding response OmpR family regulator